MEAHFMKVVLKINSEKLLGIMYQIDDTNFDTVFQEVYSEIKKINMEQEYYEDVISCIDSAYDNQEDYGTVFKKLEFEITWFDCTYTVDKGILKLAF